MFVVSNLNYFIIIEINYHLPFAVPRKQLIYIWLQDFCILYQGYFDDNFCFIGKFICFTGETLVDVINIYQKQNIVNHQTLGYTAFYIKPSSRNALQNHSLFPIKEAVLNPVVNITCYPVWGQFTEQSLSFRNQDILHKLICPHHILQK